MFSLDGEAEAIRALGLFEKSGFAVTNGFDYKLGFGDGKSPLARADARLPKKAYHKFMSARSSPFACNEFFRFLRCFLAAFFGAPFLFSVPFGKATSIEIRSERKLSSCHQRNMNANL